ncbi:MAG: hypothetical protein N2036_00930 [Bryobacteraceae bacterium]|nr:hypothetical protein [Bryobacteraceae bacterium]
MAKKSKQRTGRQAKPPAESQAKPERRRQGCVVCGAEVAPFSSENLCWVCRRLKISAWREMDSQAMMQE